MVDVAAAIQIQLRDWPIGPVVHQYLALRAVAHENGRLADDRALAEIHGLATMASGPDKTRINTLELGFGSNLHVYRFDGSFLPGRLNQVIAQAPAGEADPLRNAFEETFAEADRTLNAMGLRYRLTRQNSNTVARWVVDRLAARLALASPVHPGLLVRRPGWHNVLARPVLEQHVPRGRSWPRRPARAFDPPLEPS